MNGIHVNTRNYYEEPSHNYIILRIRLTGKNKIKKAAKLYCINTLINIFNSAKGTAIQKRNDSIDVLFVNDLSDYCCENDTFKKHHFSL